MNEKFTLFYWFDIENLLNNKIKKMEYIQIDL